MEPKNLETEALSILRDKLCEEFTCAYLLGLPAKDFTDGQKQQILAAARDGFENAWALCLDHALEHLITAAEDAQEALDEAFAKHGDEYLHNAAYALDHALERFFSSHEITSREIQ